MSRNIAFAELTKKHLPTLMQYVPVVDRVHGEHHPEFHDVRKRYEAISRKIKEAGAEKPELSEEFTALREITDHYTVPGDVCESYAAVYNMLAELDAAYQA